MSTTIRPDNLKAALAAKLAAAMSQVIELREAEEPRLTPHINQRAIVATFLVYACGVYSIAETFGNAHVGPLQFIAWYGQWTQALDDADRTLWTQLRNDRARQENGQGAALIELEVPVASDPLVTVRPGARPVRKQLVRFATSASRAASDVCDDYLRLAKRFADDFVRDYAHLRD